MKVTIPLNDENIAGLIKLLYKTFHIIIIRLEKVTSPLHHENISGFIKVLQSPCMVALCHWSITSQKKIQAS